MKQKTVRKILFTLSGGIICMLLLFWYLKSFNASQEYWEVEVGDEGPHLALVFRLVNSESKSLSRQVLFTDLEVSKIKPGTFKLPDEIDSMSGIRMTFQDITLRPGRVKLELQKHEIDIMERDISIDGVHYDWDERTPIEVVD